VIVRRERDNVIVRDRARGCDSLVSTAFVFVSCCLLLDTCVMMMVLILRTSPRTTRMPPPASALILAAPSGVVRIRIRMQGSHC